MGKLRLFLIILGLVFVILIIIGILSPKETQPTPPPENETNETPGIETGEMRTFEMGFVPIPAQPLTTEAWLSAFTLFGDNADFTLHHSAIDWEKFVDSSDAERTAASTPNLETVNFIGLMSRQNNLKLLIVIDPLRADRDEIDSKLPADIGENFGDEKVRKAFKNYAVRIAKDYKPEYLGLGSEINTYMNKHPEDVSNLVSLIDETILLVRRESPNTKITSTFQYEGLIGKVENAQWNTFAEIEPELDIVSITTYPSPWFNTPDEISEDYYNEIKEHTTKPIIIAESGWPTGGSSNFHGSDLNQKEFVEIFPELIKDVNVKLWIWWFPHDWDGEGYPDFFKTMGLRTSNGAPKSSWDSWQRIYNLKEQI